jgi:iron complex outermembrane receptor protein
LGFAESARAEVETVIVTGTRAAGVTVANAAVPVSVYGATKLVGSGYPDLGRALDQISPEINFPHTATSPSGASTRAITMKGMSPDQVLVLIDGKRWQQSAVLVFNNSVGRGTAPYDLGAVPLSAVERVEVLSDGASAQYGSDAIAGVVNIILKSNASGGIASGQTGITDRGDGFSYDLSASQGFDLGEGHLTLSGDARHQDITNRATIDPRVGFRSQQVGDPRALDFGLAADIGYDIAQGREFYTSIIGERRLSRSPGLYRLPSTSPVLYPRGFVPQVEPLIWNTTFIAGVRGELGWGFDLDVSNSFGFTNAHFDVKHTANAALGAASPIAFYAGSEDYWQDTLNATLTRDMADILVPGTLALGLEHRTEAFAMTDGSPLSFSQGGAQGFPGFAPRIPVDNSRNAFSTYVDLEIKPLTWLTLDGAGRFDDYSDFGNSFTWKGTARADVTDWLAFRGSAGTGFRAPSLQQEYFSSVVSQLNTVTNTFTRTGTYQVRDPIAIALGASPLKPETSHNYTAGAVLHPFDGLLVSADWYDIDVKDRIILSDQLKGAAVTAVLLAHGVTDVQQVQFFTNAAHTRTEGYEFSADYVSALDDATTLDSSLQYGQYRTRLLKLAPNPVLPVLPLLGATSKGLLISAQPMDKVTSAVTLTHEPYSATLSVEHFGPWVSAPLGTVFSFRSHTVLDFTGRYAITPDIQVSAGILNAFDVEPDIVTGGAALGLTYGDESPFGVNGRTYFLRLDIRN